MYRYHSTRINPDDVFICLPKGERYILEALQKGAASYIKCDRESLGVLADDYFGCPSKKLTVIGITGTNGKTSVTHFVASGLKEAGFHPYVIGTLNSPLTTPESLDIHEIMAKHLENGGTHFVMEVSSHAIDQKRIAGVRFAIKCLTNITQDHLDYHLTFEQYQKTKLSFMEEGGGLRLYPEDFQKEPIDFPVPLPGDFNVRNIQAAAAILRFCGISTSVISKSLSQVSAPPGRFESIKEGQPFLVIVDYAHTPDGLENVLKSIKDIARKQNGRVLTLFGCGGNRDRGKRPQMGKIATLLSDYVVITHDNPRTEDLDQIITDIVKGIPDNATRYQVIPDRKEAIFSIIKTANPNDVVLLAGKGHETTQILIDGPISFDDRVIARQAIRGRSL